MSKGHSLVAGLLTALALMGASDARADSAGLVAAYAFEEAAGSTAADATGANHGTLAGATRSAAGRFGSALSFDGVDDRVDIPDSASLDLAFGMTLEAWVKPTANSWRTVILKERPGGLAYGLFSSTDNHRPMAEISRGGPADTRGPSTLSPGLWSHLTTTYDGTTLRLFVNGAQVSSTAATGAITASDSPLRIGGNLVWGEYFAGLIDEVRVYNRALTATEVQADMNAPIDGQAPTKPTASATVSGDDVTLTWSAATDNVGVTEYRIYRGQTLLGTRSATAAREFTDADRPAGSYHYSVVAVDAAGNVSPSSNVVSVTVVTDFEPPTAPTLSATVANGNDVTLTWTASTDNVAVTRYSLYRGTTLLRELNATTARNYLDLDRPVGTSTYRVVARDAAGNTSPDGTLEVTIGPDTTPPAVSLPGDCTGTKLVLGTRTLTPVATDAIGVTEVALELDGQPLHSVTGSSLSYQWDTKTAADGNHTIRAIARDAAGNEGSATCEFKLFNPQLTLTVTPAPGSTVSGEITHSATILGNGEPLPTTGWLDGYPVQGVVFTVPWGGIVTDATYPYENKWQTLSWSAQRQATVRATANIVGHPSVTGESTFTVDNRPSAPADFTATVVGGDDVQLGWGPAPAGENVAYWRIYRDGVYVTEVSSRTWTDTDRPAGTYQYRINAGNGYWGGEYSEAEATVSPDTTPPSTPLIGACDNNTVRGQISLRPTATDDRGGDVTLTIELDGEPFWTGRANSIIFWNTNQVPNGTHVMTAVARDAAGNETASGDCRWNVHNPAYSVAFEGLTDGATVSGQVPVKAVPFEDGEPPALFDGYVVFGGPAGLPGGPDMNAPYEQTWDTTKAANGTHTVKLELYLYGGSRPVATREVQVTVANVAPVPTGLVAEYALDSAPGTVTGATAVAGGRFGGAFSFDGNGDSIAVPDANPLDLQPGMTLEAWVKPDRVDDWRTVLLKERPGQLAYALYSSAEGGPWAEVTAGTQRHAMTGSALAVNQWSHLAATYDLSTLRLYVNGVQVASVAVSGTLFNSAGALKLGGNGIWGEWFSGLIDEVRVYERALTAAEIQADMTRPIAAG